jgi:prolipoprotein diacylglyceryltransferase
MSKTHPPPWGNWATCGWYGLVFVLSILVAAVVVTVALAEQIDSPGRAHARDLESLRDTGRSLWLGLAG